MNEKRFPEPVEALMIIVGIFTVMIFIGLLFVDGGDPSALDSDFQNNSKIFYLIGGLAFLIIPLAYVRARKYDMVEVLRLRPVSKDILWLSIVLAISAVVVSDEADRLVQILIPIPDWFMEQMESLRAETTMDWILIIFSAVFLAAVSEELLFRGFLQVSLETKVTSPARFSSRR
jgi:membrane protease YdiL (CAAX protease family)